MEQPTPRKWNWDKLKRELEERPLVVMGIASSALYGLSTFMDANTRRRNSVVARKSQKTYDKNVERLIKKDRSK